MEKIRMDEIRLSVVRLSGRSHSSAKPDTYAYKVWNLLGLVRTDRLVSATLNPAVLPAADEKLLLHFKRVNATSGRYRFCRKARDGTEEDKLLDMGIVHDVAIPKAGEISMVLHAHGSRLAHWVFFCKEEGARGQF